MAILWISYQALSDHQSNNCVIQSGGFTCEQQKGWGKCNNDWMIQNEYCMVTCNKCTQGADRILNSPFSSLKDRKPLSVDWQEPMHLALSRTTKAVFIDEYQQFDTGMIFPHEWRLHQELTDKPILFDHKAQAPGSLSCNQTEKLNIIKEAIAGRN